MNIYMKHNKDVYVANNTTLNLSHQKFAVGQIPYWWYNISDSHILILIHRSHHLWWLSKRLHIHMETTYYILSWAISLNATSMLFYQAIMCALLQNMVNKWMKRKSPLQCPHFLMVVQWRKSKSTLSSKEEVSVCIQKQCLEMEELNWNFMVSLHKVCHMHV